MVDVNVYTYARMHARVRAHARMQARTHSRRQARTHACSHICMHAGMHARGHVRRHVRTYARTHARTHARAQVHIRRGHARCAGSSLLSRILADTEQYAVCGSPKAATQSGTDASIRRDMEGFLIPLLFVLFITT